MKLQFLSKWNYCSLYFHCKTCGNTKNIIGKVQIILITFRSKNILLFVSFLNENTSFIDTLTLAEKIWLWKNKTKLSNLTVICYTGVPEFGRRNSAKIVLIWRQQQSHARLLGKKSQYCLFCFYIFKTKNKNGPVLTDWVLSWSFLFLRFGQI